MFFIVALGILIPDSSLIAQCFGGDPSSNGPDWDYSKTIEENYNAARRWEESNLGLSANCLGDMVEPNVGWLGMNEESTALYIHNSERVARGKLPLYDVESNLDGVAQNHSDWQIANGVFSHGGDPSLGSNSSYKLCSDCSTSLDGSSPFDRMNHDPPLQSQWQWESENIGVRVTSGSSLADFVPERIYAFIYKDAGSGWGHRHAVLHDFNNDWGDGNTEGFIGVGIKEGNGYEICQFGCDNWNFAKFITIDYYDPAGGASGFSFKGLPIELLAFTAQKSKSNVLLSWSTSTELNNDYFLIEKSTDGIEFEKLTKIDGAIDSKSQKDYKYTDYNPVFGINYYRLKQVDLDGNFSYSNVEKVEFENENAVAISPNPFDNFIIVNSPLKYDNGSIQIVDLEGKTVYNSAIPAGNNTTKFYLPNLNSGIYFVKIKNNNFKKVFKLIKL